MGEIKKIEDSEESRQQTAESAWLCSTCGEMLVKLANPSTAIFYEKGREFFVTYDIMSTTCSKCGSFQERESSLLNVAIERTLSRKEASQKGELIFMAGNPRDALVINIRARAWGIKDVDNYFNIFPDENIRMPKVEMIRFLKTLSEKEREIYKIIVDNFEGIIGDPKIFKLIQDVMGMTPKEARFRYDTVLEKVRGFRREEGKATY